MVLSKVFKRFVIKKVSSIDGIQNLTLHFMSWEDSILFDRQIKRNGYFFCSRIVHI